eukprot:3144235-Prymnesium_polylepis.1
MYLSTKASLSKHSCNAAEVRSHTGRSAAVGWAGAGAAASGGPALNLGLQPSLCRRRGRWGGRRGGL